ncbi:endonuclease V, putative [Eimeria necatrix]|uniref:Endonuclease V, putative n=1 Tax=Eimeria necatrix TaxID=51315 RepID=U6N643_9EIME|nr:endonuclease V, putative [Eimeria necatrix]CDJ69380.1 endonuclease V, putative [Eimeria necatrix]
MILKCVALTLTVTSRFLGIAPSVAYTTSSLQHISLFSAALSAFSSGFRRQRSATAASLRELHNSPISPLERNNNDFRRYREMKRGKAKEVKAEPKVDATKDGTFPEDPRAKRKHGEAKVKPGDEQLDQDQLLQTEPQSGNVAGAIDRTGEMEEKSETNESVPTKDIHVAKKRRGAPKARAKASAGKRSATAEGAANGVLEPDEEYTTLANSAAKSRKFVGAHISAAGGVHNAPLSCFNVKGQAFALFLKCQRKWVSPPLADTAIAGFKLRCDSLKMDKDVQVLPHGSYLINVANPDKAKQENAYNALLDDLQRCEALGIKLYNIHPGSTVGECSKEEGIRNIAAAVNRAHKDTKFVVVVLENMAGQKNVVGSKFEDLRDIIELVENKDRWESALTLAIFSQQGYDIRTPEKFENVMKEFDSIVGYKFLRGMHLNDSKSELSSGLDRHELLGKGHLGLAPFKYIMQHQTRFKDMPLILETPDPTEGTIWKKEIKQMYSFLNEEEEK